MTQSERELVSAAFDLDLDRAGNADEYHVRRFVAAREKALRERLGDKYEEYAKARKELSNG